MKGSLYTSFAGAAVYTALEKALAQLTKGGNARGVQKQESADEWRIPGFLFAELFCETPIHRTTLVENIREELEKAGIEHPTYQQMYDTVKGWEKSGELKRQELKNGATG